MTPRVFVVTEGETYYDAWIAHAVFSERVTAERYATELVKGNEAQRWPNCCVIEFEVNKPGHIEQHEVGMR